jgi:hypothetical protein
VQPSIFDLPEKKEQIPPPKVSNPQKKEASMKPTAKKLEEELIIPKSNNQLDEQPIGRGRKVFDDM